jgi:FHA domain
MTERGQAARRPARVPLPRRSRLRWAAAAGVAVCWLVLLDVSGSVIAATMLLVFLAGLGVAGVLVLRALGVSRDHPWVRQLAARPWRDGQEVLHLALRHLSDVFVITPSRSLLAPDVVELRMNPDDLHSLTERMDLGLIAESVAEVYQEQVAARGARFNGTGLAEARVIPDPSVPPGRYRLQGLPVDAGAQPGFQLAYAGAQAPGAEHLGAEHLGAEHLGAEHAAAAPQVAGAYPVVGYPPAEHPGAEYSPAPYPGFVGHDGNTRAQQEAGRPAAVGRPTVIELSRSPVPALRLVTGSSVAETRVSGARAGRGAVELALPDVPTVSREHARFTFSDGRWWIANLGRNGLTLNGTALAGEQPLSTGDLIRWGMRSDALLSRVEIG